MPNVKVVLTDGKEKMYYNAEAYVGGAGVLHVVRKTAYGAETTLEVLQRSAYQSWQSIKEN